MTRLTKADLLERILSSIAESGRAALVESDDHPFVLRIEGREGFVRVRVHIWNITHGGGAARANDEYRIQATGVTSFSAVGVDRTIVLGWWEDEQVFVAWDASMHEGTLGQSPSFQVQERYLRNAAASGFAAQRKGNAEVVLAFSPSYLAEYAIDGLAIHSHGILVNNKATDAEPQLVNVGDSLADIEHGGPRQSVLAQIHRKLRDASFKKRVLDAYGHRCAMCETQLQLIDAAHIIPAADANIDATNNGLALCASHHRAFDSALISADASFQLVLNPDRIRTLESMNKAGRLSEFKLGLRVSLMLPQKNVDRPLPAHILEGNRIRGWKRYVPLAM